MGFKEKANCSKKQEVKAMAKPLILILKEKIKK